jgi:ATP-dependent RNA helicase DeaD
MNIGRERNADPRWLVPLICRRGHVTNREIGSIRIFDRETKFEIARAAAERFATVIRRTDSEDEDIRIEAIRPEQPARKAPHKPGQKPGQSRATSPPLQQAPGQTPRLIPRPLQAAKGSTADQSFETRASLAPQDEVPQLLTSP